MDGLDLQQNHDSTTSGPCPLCEEILYNKTIFHVCSQKDDGSTGVRIDIFLCSKCHYPKYREDHEEIDLGEYHGFCECDKY